jgi:RNA polymerase sigma-70 factor (ECF subfamily)
MTDSGEPVVTRSMESSGETDEQLLERVGRGDAAALAALYDRYRSMAFALASRITSDAQLAEDVVQEAFLGVWRNAARYSASRASVRTWTLAIVHHRAIDALRRRRPVSELPEGEAPPPSLVMPDVWQEVAGRLDRAAIGRALDSLSPAQREALELAYYGGLTQQEIASRTGTPLGTVKSRVRLALLALRELLTSGAPGAELLASGPEASEARPVASQPGSSSPQSPSSAPRPPSSAPQPTPSASDASRAEDSSRGEPPLEGREPA